MDKSKNQGAVPKRGLGLLTHDKRITRSISRALENQVAGSLFTQIDTGIGYPVVFIPVDLLNRCTARVFGQPEAQTNVRQEVSVTDRFSFESSDSTLSISRKIEKVLEMSDSEQGATVGDIPRRVPEVETSTYGGAVPRRAPGAEAAASGRTPSTLDEKIEHLTQVMEVMMQQNAQMPPGTSLAMAKIGIHPPPPVSYAEQKTLGREGWIRIPAFARRRLLAPPRPALGTSLGAKPSR